MKLAMLLVSLITLASIVEAAPQWPVAWIRSPPPPPSPSPAEEPSPPPLPPPKPPPPSPPHSPVYACPSATCVDIDPSFCEALTASQKDSSCQDLLAVPCQLTCDHCSPEPEPSPVASPEPGDKCMCQCLEEGQVPRGV